MRIGVIGSPRFACAPPFAGGLEAHTWQLERGLTARGHDVTVFDVTSVPAWSPSSSSRADVSNAPDAVVHDHHVMLSVIRRIMADGRFDVVHDNSTHYLPVAMTPVLGAPLVTTLHCPPTPWLESAFASVGPDVGRVLSVSQSNAHSWRHVVDPTVVRNGVDVDVWQPRTGRRHGAVWLGRLVREKAPHHAIDAARRAGIHLTLAGPAHDPAYFDEMLAPRLNDDGGTYAGHLDVDAAAGLLGRAAVALVTPIWPEPFGLVVAEALAAGAPVAGFAAGALPELLDDDTGRLVAVGDVDALAEAICEAVELDSAACRSAAVERFSVQRMLDDYEREFECVAR